jgi:glycine/D-amino acid oxidase-like deaminating enzyme
MIRYGRSPWIDRFPKSRVPSLKPLRGTFDTDVVIVGGGLTGCASAYAFAAAGVKVMLLEADRLARGATAASNGIISDDPGVEFVAIEKALGLRAARRAWQAWRRAALDLQALLRRLDVKCGLVSRPSITVAVDSERAVRLKREHTARRAAGLDHALLNARAAAGEVAIQAPAAIRSKESATIDPYRAALGLAAAAAGRGAQLFESTPVRRITFTRKHADVHTGGGSIRTRRVIVATGTPTALFHSLVRHFWLRTTYLALTDRVPAKIRQALGRRDIILRDTASPAHLVRWVNDEQLLVTGADREQTPPRERERALVQRTGQLMYELSILYPDISGLQAAYGWDAAYARTSDGLPYIGAHRNFPHHLFAFGDSSHSVTGAYLASRIFLRQHLGDHDPSDDVFGFHR